MKRRNAVALDVGHRGVAAHTHDTAGLHRTRGKRRDHCAVTDEHYAATCSPPTLSAGRCPAVGRSYARAVNCPCSAGASAAGPAPTTSYRVVERRARCRGPDMPAATSTPLFHDGPPPPDSLDTSIRCRIDAGWVWKQFFLLDASRGHPRRAHTGRGAQGPLT